MGRTRTTRKKDVSKTKPLSEARVTRKRVRTRRATKTIQEWDMLANQLLRKLLREIQTIPALLARAKCPVPWQAELKLVNGPQMSLLNAAYRGKNYATDILSFPTPSPFRLRGVLGELVICLPVLKKQAKEMNHSPEHELQVLLIHGILHLLGFDHEKSRAAAIEMAALENSILGNHLGLIDRSGSGKKRK